jgi:hypothetical protein
MTELRYPNETRDYRAAREALMKEEKELGEKVKAVCASLSEVQGPVIR